MQQDHTTVIIGAGPYGLSVAAHLKAKGVQTLVFGKPMGFWQEMPEQMYLKSVLSASSLSDPAGKYTITDFFKATNTPGEEPIPLPTFLKYGEWFREKTVGEVDTTFVQKLAYDGRRFQLDLVDGRAVQAERVIVAVGVERFTYRPDFAHELPRALASHTQDHQDFATFKDRKVAVIGTGQSGLETTALLNEAGAEVELIARSPVRWIDRTLYDRVGPAKHIFYPPSDVGPPGINWLIAFPQFFKYFPDDARHKMDQRAIRPAGAQWLRSRVDKKVTITEEVQITRATAQGDVLHLELSNGTTRDVEHLFMGTGYRASLDKLPFIDPELSKKVQTRNGYPTLNGGFEASVPQLHFVGALAGHTFGPICRFVAGSRASAQQIAHYVGREA